MGYTKIIKINETNIFTDDKNYCMSEQQCLGNFIYRITNRIT